MYLGVNLCGAKAFLYRNEMLVMNVMSRILAILLLLPTLLTAQTTAKLPVIKAPQFKNITYAITKYGAAPDGYTLNTKSIQAAIDACHKNGGGTVQVPPGLWLTGPIVLKSNVNLNLSSGATLLFTKDKSQYPLVRTNWEGLDQMRNQSPISAEGASNIGITGKGIIDGNGDAWRYVKKEKLTDSHWKKLVESGGVLSDNKKTWYPSEGFKKASTMDNPGGYVAGKNYDDVKDFLRPNLMVLTKCKYILLEGVTFQNSPAWCLHPLMSEHLTVRNITVRNPWYAQNGDGLDVESCKNVLIENSFFDVGDDGICIKSGRDAEGRKRAMPTENVIVRGCTVYASHGGFVVGSEMSGGAKNIHVSDCTFIGSDIGLRFKTTRGRGGVVEDIFINNIYMKDIPGDAILFDMYYAARDPIPLAGEERALPKVEFKAVDETTPQFKNIHISNVYVNGAEKAVFIRGLPEMHINNLQFSNLVLQSKKGLDIQEASNISFKNVKLYTTELNPVVDIINSDNISFDKLEYSNLAELLFRINGERSKPVKVTNTDATKAKKAYSYELGAVQP
jgi:polygalacturonase